MHDNFQRAKSLWAGWRRRLRAWRLQTCVGIMLCHAGFGARRAALRYAAGCASWKTFKKFANLLVRAFLRRIVSQSCGFNRLWRLTRRGVAARRDFQFLLCTTSTQARGAVDRRELPLADARICGATATPFARARTRALRRTFGRAAIVAASFTRENESRRAQNRARRRRARARG